MAVSNGLASAEDEEAPAVLDEPLLLQYQQQRQQEESMLLRRSQSNTSSQVAIVGSDLCPIESLDYESQMFVIWGTMLYERSIMEFKLGLPVWQECLEVAVEKFEFAGASPTDIAVMIKNHCSIDTTSKGLGFNIDEIVQAWNEMYEAKTWQSNIPCFRLEPLFEEELQNFIMPLNMRSCSS